jgi:hypothetical protein
MVVCPIAIVAGCRKCPVFTVCPLKGVIGNYVPEPPAVQGQDAQQTRANAATAQALNRNVAS